jgi:hypothetical protein
MRLPTVRPSPKTASTKTPDKAKNELGFTKPIVTTMKRMFPSVDGLCDATFIKKVTGLSTKKNALLFIAETQPVYNFFNLMELKMRENVVIIRKEIEQFFSTKDVLVAISNFKIQVKQLEAEQKILKKAQEQEAIIEQNRERIIQEEKNRIIAQYHEEQAELAKQKGDEKAAQDHMTKALKLLEKQKEQDRALEVATTESSDSSHHESDEDHEDHEVEEDDEATVSRVSSRTSASASTSIKQNRGIADNHNHDSHDYDGEADTSSTKTSNTVSRSEQKTEEAALDIKRVKEIFEATHEAGFLVAKQGNKEFKISDFFIDVVNAKLVINLEPEQARSVKVSF